MLQYRIIPVEHKETYPWLLHKHYAKTIPNIMHSFGLYDIDNILQGVCCFGTPANNHNNQLGKFKMLELVRLCVNDNLPRNTLSFFVSQCLEQIKKLYNNIVIISYADMGKNHCGYIYQATNWIYTGVGGGVDYYINERQEEIHSRIMSDLRIKNPQKSRDEIANELKWKKVKGTFKHRYFYPLGNKKIVKNIIDLIKHKYQIKNYPKDENKRYDSGYQIKEIQRILF